MDNDDLISKLNKEKEVAIEYQKRRHDQWKETYEFYRDIVETNDLTQRQEVNIPIMKETKKTLMSRIDDPPDVVFDCLEKGEGGREKEIIVEEIWQDDFDKCNFEAIDILEKNNVLLYGRTFKFLNFTNNKFSVEVPDNLDVVIDPKTNPIDIETARSIIRLHIFKPLREILADPKYLDKGKQELKKYLQNQGQGEEDESGGLIQFKKEDTQEARDDILESLGVENFDEFGAADVTVELNEHLTLIWDNEKKKYVRYVVVVAADNAILYKETLKDTLGIDFWPVITWADDADVKDFWTDGIGDVVRTPNKVMNIYFSTMLENRTYRNLGMMWYLPADGYNPQTFEPEPFGQYPAPMIADGRGGFLTVEQVIKQMDIPALEDNLVSIDFLIKLVERATAATAIEKGVAEKKQITLGEVEELTAKASERIVSIAKFYRRAWKEFAWKWRKIREANASKDSPIKLYKKGVKGSYFEKEVYPKDWISQAGYKEIVKSSAEQEGEETKGFQKLMLIAEKFPNNPAIQKLVQTRMLEMLDLTPDELKEIKEAERLSTSQQEMPSAEGTTPPAELAPRPVSRQVLQ